MTATLLQILSHIRPGIGFTCWGNQWETLKSDDGSPVPSLEEIEAARPTVEAALDVSPVPESVPMAEFRKALRAASIDPNVISQSLSGNPTAQDDWEYQPHVRRNHPLVLAMSQQLGKTNADVDAIFIYAESLQ